MERIKNSLCVALALVVILVSSSVNVLADETKSTEGKEYKVDRVLEEYYSAVSALESTDNKYVKEVVSKENLQYIAVQELNKLGYEAYAVDADSYDNVERALSTDLESLGVTPEASYIIVVHGEEDGTVNPSSTIGSSFTYNYGGSSYVLRYVTIASNDNSLMSKASSANVLNSRSRTIIQNFLNATFGLIVSSYSEVVGFVADVLGLNISNFSTSANSSIYLHGATNWGRRYTQVYSNYGSWLNGSYTEYARCAQHFGGYYVNSSGANIQVNTSETVTYKYSSKYYDSEWKKESAVLGYLNSYIVTDRTGDISYTCNGNTLFTHAENF